jgi:hypothetical protein
MKMVFLRSAIALSKRPMSRALSLSAPMPIRRRTLSKPM